MAPLYAQFRAQRKHLRLTNQKLAEGAGVELITVARALGPEPDTMSLPLALRLGAALGFDPAHVALVHARDVAKDDEFNARDEDRAEDQDRFKRQRLQLEAHLSWQKTPFCAANSGRRLAFRAERIGTGHSIETIARQAAGRASGSWQHQMRLMKLYEASKVSVDEELLETWLRALSVLSQCKVDLAALDKTADRLRHAHPGMETVEWHQYKKTGGGASMRTYCPTIPGYELLFGGTWTTHGPLDIQFIHAHQPRKVQKGLVRLVAFPHEGFEIGIVLQGEARLTLSETPFPSEILDRTREYQIGRDGVVHDAVYLEGVNSVVCFPSIFYHHRVEFLSKECLVAMINIRGNLLLARHWKHP